MNKQLQADECFVSCVDECFVSCELLWVLHADQEACDKLAAAPERDLWVAHRLWASLRVHASVQQHALRIQWKVPCAVMHQKRF